jgi:tetratricopeptide (TPR) repeat protein
MQKLIREGDRRYGQGDLGSAINRYHEARELAEAATRDDPVDAEAYQQLATIQYVLGDWHIQRQEYESAIEVLNAAGTTWEKVAELQGSLAGQGSIQVTDMESMAGLPGWGGGPETEQRIADVAITRARAHTEVAHAFSALADAQQALFAYLVFAQSAEPPPDLDLARVAAWAAYVQMKMGGDLEVTAAAAGYAVARYGQAFLDVPGTQGTELRAAHLHIFGLAADVAYLSYLALGEADLAATVRRLIETSGASHPDRPERETVDSLRARPRLPDMLAELAPELHARLPDLAAASQPVVPLLRIAPGEAPEVAAELASLAEAAFGRGDLRYGLSLGLEAHVLFAGASQLGTMQMRYQLYRYGPAWARVLYRCGQLALQDGAETTAVDAASWLTGVVGGLFPHATYDQEIRTLLLTCTRWQQELYSQVGDREAAENVVQAIDALRQLT